MIKEKEITANFKHSSALSNENFSEKRISPRSITHNLSTSTEFKKNQEISNPNMTQKNYSPFVIKRSPNLMNSNSSSKSKYHTENYYLQNSTTFSSGSKTFSKSNKIYTPSPGILKERLSDRFIPMNKGENLLEKFEMAEKEFEREVDNGDQTSRSNYSYLLENNFTSHLQNSTSNVTPVKSKLFSFRTEQKRKFSGIHKEPNKENLYKLNGIGSNTSLNSNSLSRKISAKPYKVIDSPELIDDFYLNLVDWSSKNDLVVAETNSVYIWCANKTQKVKLLSYEGDKYVSSVMWNHNGTEVAVGNSEGSVEIWDCKLIF